jgi:IclR family pca regulon transcriptional regulator
MSTTDQDPASSASKSHTLLARDWIAGLERGIAVIEAFDEEHPKLTAKQVGDRCGLARTAARRYLLTLEHLGFVATDAKQYWLTPRVLRLGQRYLASARLPRIAQPFLQRISASIQEIAYLAVLDEGEIVYVARNGPNRVMNSGFVLGSRVVSHVTAAGLLLMANRPVAEVKAWLSERELPAFTPHTITDKTIFLERLATFRRQGWAISERQFDLDCRGIAVPLRDGKGDIHGALSVVMPIKHESVEDAVQRVLPALQGAAQSLRDII